MGAQEVLGDIVAEMRKFIAERSSPPADMTNCFDDISTFGRLEEKWATGALAEMLKVSAASLAKCKTYDPDSIKHPVCFLHNIGPQAMIPAEFQDKRVLFKLLSNRRASVGGRVRLLKDNSAGFFCRDGSLDWKLGVYDLTFAPEGGRLMTVTHRPSKATVEIEDGAGIDDSFDLLNNFSDVSAEVAKGNSKARRFKLKDLFGKQAGPNTMPAWVGKA